MDKYTTIHLPACTPLTAIKAFAEARGLIIRRLSNGQLVMIDQTLPDNVRRLPARPRPVTTGPELGGAA